MKTVIGKQYCVTCDSACDIVDTATGNTIHLHHEGEAQSYFTAIGIDSVPSDDTAVVTEVFKSAPAGNGGGGYIESNLNVGHGAADAVAAVCTLTLGDLGTGGTLADSNGQSVELENPHAYATGSVELADAAAAGTITFGTHDAVELPADPATRATGGMVIVDPNKGGTLTIGEWSKAFAAAQGEKASGTFSYMVGAVTVDGTPVTPPADAASVEGWNDAFLAAGVGLICTGASQHGEIEVSVEATEPGTAGNSITISVETYPDVTLSGGTDGRTVAALLAELEADTDFPCTLVHDGEGNVTLTAKVAGTAGNYSMSCTEAGFISPDTALVGGEDARTAQEVVDILNDSEDCPAVAVLDEDEQGIALTAKEYGVNDTITITGDLFENAQGMSGGHGDYTVAELVTAIEGEFDDITPTAGETEGTITLTANTPGAAANAIEYTATGCFGSGTVKQGSTTRGRNAVEQTAFKIYLNGEEFTGGSVTVDPAPTQGSENAVSSGGVYTALGGKQDALSAGDGIALTGGTIAVDASGTVADGDTLPVSGETVAAALGGYLPLAAGVAPEVKGNVTFSGSVVAASVNLTDDLLLANKRIGIVDGETFWIRRSSWSSAASEMSIECKQFASACAFTFTAKASALIVLHYTSCCGLGIVNRNAASGSNVNANSPKTLWVSQELNAPSASKAQTLPLVFGRADTAHVVRGASLELRVCDQTDTAGARDTVLTLDAAKLQKLIDLLAD